MSSPTITAIIITRNEELMIANCIETLRWCQEILVIDSDSSDQTADIARRLGAKVVSTQSESFAERRNLGLEHVHTDWLFYIDADKRVTPQLAKEILVQIETTSSHALEMHRQNMMYGKYFLNGGWGNEYVQRIFRKTALAGWKGDIHESPIYEGEYVRLHSSLFHLTHRNTIDGLYKTAMWTPLEAKLLFDANISPVTAWTLLRKTMMEFIRRAFFKGGRKDGIEGLIEAGIQAMNRFLVYVQVWELQQQPSLTEKYHAKEMDFMKMWKKTTVSELSPILKEQVTVIDQPRTDHSEQSAKKVEDE
jgi:glycosyltransferase involved in cell wall biosynthesis